MTVDPLQSCAPELAAYSSAVSARRALEAALSTLEGAVAAASENYMKNCPYGIAEDVGEEVFEDLNEEEESELRRLLEELWDGPIYEDPFSPKVWDLFLDVFGGIHDLPGGVVQDPTSCLTDAMAAGAIGGEMLRVSAALKIARNVEANRLKDYHRCLDAARFQAARRNGLIPPS